MSLFLVDIKRWQPWQPDLVHSILRGQITYSGWIDFWEMGSNFLWNEPFRYGVRPRHYFLDKSSSQFSEVNSCFLKSLTKPSSGRWTFNWRHKACIHAEEIIDFSLDSCGFFCRACKFRSSGFSIREKKTMSTVAREMLGLNVEEIKLLKTLNLISGKGVVGWDAVTQGKNANQTNSQIKTE